MLVSDFDYDLPNELIAQFPEKERDYSRMMVLNKSDKSILHKHFYDITEFLTSDDLLVINNTKVIPARLLGKKTTGANIEIFLLKNIEENVWEALIKPQKRVEQGTMITFCKDFSAIVIDKSPDVCHVKLQYKGNLYENLDKYGQIPLPPYIERKLTTEEIIKLDKTRYQTVFAQKEGSVAAPTAGLHFTDDILKKLKNKGVEIAEISLNVGLGTFRPVSVENLDEHKMHSEEFEIDEKNATIINNAIKNGKNIVAVGTTSVRTLETIMQKYGKIIPVKDSSNLFIYPGFEFKLVNKIITNFHLPKSTLIMLISAFAGKDFVFKAYQDAICEKYRFFSYGDCMLIQ